VFLNVCNSPSHTAYDDMAIPHIKLLSTLSGARIMVWMLPYLGRPRGMSEGLKLLPWTFFSFFFHTPRSAAAQWMAINVFQKFSRR